MRNFYLVVGLLGAGKDSLINAVQKTVPMKLLKSYTTRHPRYNGENTHTFINKEEYDSLHNKLATFDLNGVHYCSTKEQVDNSDVYVIDNEGARQFLNNYGGNKPVKIIYIDTPSELRKQRMIKRGDNENDIHKRIEHDEGVIDIQDKADIIIQNINFDTAKKQIINFINKEECLFNAPVTEKCINCSTVIANEDGISCGMDKLFRII